MPPARSDLEESSLVTDPRSSSPLKRWILLDGNRIVLSVVLAAGLLAVLLALFGIGLFRPTDGETVGTLLTALIGGTLPFITIVLAVIQLVLSQELGWPEGLRDRFEGAEAFREDVEAVTGVSVSPPPPPRSSGSSSRRTPSGRRRCRVRSGTTPRRGYGDGSNGTPRRW